MAYEVKKTLECLEAQTYKDFQLVIVDDSKTNRVERVVARSHLNIKYIRRPYERGYRVASAWNTLWQSADVGPEGVLILTNSHILTRPNWVEAHLAYHKTNDNCCVIGVYHEDTWDAPTYIDMWGTATNLNRRFIMFRCYSESLRKKHIEAIGGWDEVYEGEWGKEDGDLAYRLQKHGIQWILGHSVDVIHLSHPPRQGKDRGKRNRDIFFNKFPELRSEGW
jgi:GT2 family glycosyltransferase